MIYIFCVLFHIILSSISHLWDCDPVIRPACSGLVVIPPEGLVRQGQLKLDPQGYVVVKPGTPQTFVEGVYAAGDVQDKEWRQVG